MPLVKRSAKLGAPAKTGSTSGGKVKKPKVEVILPTKPTVPASSLRDFIVFIHGVKKIGKTRLLSEEEGSFFLEFDPLQKGLSILQRHMDDWRCLKAYIDTLAGLEKKDFPYRNGVIDRIDLAYSACYDWVKVNKLGGSDPSDLGGYESAGAWNKIRTEFASVVMQFLSLPWAARFICHSKETEIATRDGGTVTAIVPDLGKQADGLITGQADIIGCYRWHGQKRILIIEGDESVVCGNRCEGHFLTPDGERVRDIPMGNSGTEAYENFVRAFENDQKRPSIIDTGDGERKVLRKLKKKK